MEPNDNRYSKDLTSPAKTVADKNKVMADQNIALSIVVQHQKSRELTAAYRITALENSLAWERWYNQQSREIIDELTARETNNDELIFALQGCIAELEEENETAAWTELSLRNEISLLKEQVDSSNTSSLEESIDWERRSNSRLREEIWIKDGDIDKLQSKVRYLQETSHPVEKTAGKRDNYSSDDDKSLFSKSNDEGNT
jgi:hypothetical protein